MKWRWITPVILTLLSVISGLGMWILNDLKTEVSEMSRVVHSVDKRIYGIESNRFTAGDGNKMLELINQKADKDEVPPKWFYDQVKDLNDRVMKLESNGRRK